MQGMIKEALIFATFLWGEESEYSHRGEARRTILAS
jgi:hypothetical protein